MKSRILLLFIAYVLPLCGMSQDVTINWGEDLESGKAILKIIEDNEQGIFVLASQKKNIFIEHYSPGGAKLDFSQVIEFPVEDGIQTELADVIYMDGHLILFAVNLNKKTKSFSIYGYQLNENARFTKARKKILTARAYHKRFPGDFSIKMSPDHSKLAIYRFDKDPAKPQAHSLKVVVMNGALETMKEINQKMPDAAADELPAYSDAIITNDATFYLAARYVRWGKDVMLALSKAGIYDANAMVTKRISLFEFAPSNGFEVREIPVETGELHASSMAIKVDGKGNVVGGGFYAGFTKKGGTGINAGLAGTYFLRIDPEQGKVIHFKSEPFSKDLTAQFIKEKKAAQGQLVPAYYLPRNLIVKESGDVYLIAEYFRFDQVDFGTNPTSGLQNVENAYIHGPILAAKLGSSNQVEWVRSIPKNQHCQSSIQSITKGTGGTFIFGASAWNNFSEDELAYHSFTIAEGEGKLNFIYNDNPKNVEFKHFRDTKKLQGFRGAVPVSATIDENGNLTKKILMEKDRSEVVVRPGISLAKNPDRLIIYGTRGKKEKFGTIDF